MKIHSSQINRYAESISHKMKKISNYPTYHKKCFNCYDDKDKLNKLDIELNFDKTDVDTSNKM